MLQRFCRVSDAHSSVFLKAPPGGCAAWPWLRRQFHGTCVCGRCRAHLKGVREGREARKALYIVSVQSGSGMKPISSLLHQFFSPVTQSTAILNFDLSLWVAWAGWPMKQTLLYVWSSPLPTSFSFACLHHGGLTAKALLSQAGHVTQILAMGVGVSWGFWVCFLFPGEAGRPAHHCSFLFPRLDLDMTIGAATDIWNLSPFVIRCSRHSA